MTVFFNHIMIDAMDKKQWRILVTGITSIHGWPIYKKILSHFGPDRVFGIKPPKMDLPEDPNTAALCITDKKALSAVKESFRPTHIAHCAGVCDLDVCEERPHWAESLNRGGARVMVDLFGEDCRLYYLSTDLVFSGEKPPVRGYAEHHLPDPVSVAGRTFSLAEKEIRQAADWCIIRLGLPLGDSITGGKGAIDWVESRFKRNLPVSLFYDELRSCISCEKIGKAVVSLLLNRVTGLYHYGGDTLSLYDIGRRVLEKGGYPAHLLQGLYRHQEVGGPPRIGDVSLNSGKMEALLSEL